MEDSLTFFLVVLCTTILSPLKAQVHWEAIEGLSGVEVVDYAFGDPGQIYIINKDDGIYRSEDYGATWSAFNNGLPDSPPFYRASISVAPNGHVYLMYRKKAFYRLNLTFWVRIADSVFFDYELFSIGPNCECNRLYWVCAV